jgi:hypothetical protein
LAAAFFDMPHGRSEDWVLLEFRDKLMEVHGDPNVDEDTMWTEFRKKVESSLENRTVSVDGGMDRGI